MHLLLGRTFHKKSLGVAVNPLGAAQSATPIATIEEIPFPGPCLA